MSLIAALVVLATAELAVRTVHSRLAEPLAWPTPELQHKFDRIRQLSANHGVDVVLVGDSMMDVGGDPAGLAAADPGVRVYNASLAGETLPTIYDWTTRVVVPRLRPKVVVIGLSSNSLNAGLRSDAVARAYSTSRVVRAAKGTGDWLDRTDAWLRRWSVLYRYRSVLRKPIGSAAGPTKPGQIAVFDPPLSSDGHDLAFAGDQYLEVGGVRYTLSQARADAITNLLNQFTIGPGKAALIEQMIAVLRHEGIRVALVNMPITADFVSFHPAGAADYTRAAATLKDAASAAGAIFASPGIWPTALFADPVHLNSMGTARFTDVLAPLIDRENKATGPP